MFPAAYWVPSSLWGEGLSCFSGVLSDTVTPNPLAFPIPSLGAHSFKKTEPHTQAQQTESCLIFCPRCCHWQLVIVLETSKPITSVQLFSSHQQLKSAVLSVFSASLPPGILLKMQIPGLSLRPTESETPSWSPPTCISTSPLADADTVHTRV